MTDEPTKRCLRCGKEKERGDFYNAKGYRYERGQVVGYDTGRLVTYCMDCHRALGRERIARIRASRSA